MNLGVALREYLIGISSVQTLVQGRIHPLVLPPNPVFPCIRYVTTEEMRPESSKGGTGLVAATLQMDFFTKKYIDTYNLSQVVRKVLQGFVGTMGSSPNQVVVQNIVFSNGYEDFSNDVGNYRILHDYHIWYEEELPSVSRF